MQTFPPILQHLDAKVVGGLKANALIEFCSFECVLVLNCVCAVKLDGLDNTLV